MRKHLSRRTLLSALGGGVAGGVLVAAGSQDAQAGVTLGQLTVGDGQEEVRGQVQSVELACVAGYRWDIPNHASTPEMWQMRLHVGDSDTEIATADGRASGREQSNTTQMTGSVLDAPEFSASDFQPGEQAVTAEIPVLLELEVIGGGQTLATASQRTTMPVEVTQAGYDASLHGGVGGRLEVGVSGE